MSQLIIHGPPQSSYVRTARWAAAEKGVVHTLTDPAGLHPYKKFPTMKHGDLELAETQAIVHYIDAAFDGPALVPTDPAELGRAEQWVSYLNCYMYKHFVPDYAFKYIFAKGEPDRAAVDATLENLEYDLTLLEKGLEGREWLAGGSSISIADLFFGPAIATVANFPEGAASIERKPNLKKLMTRIGSRDAYKSIQPA